jgi:DNA-binding transcriptional MerR regulator
MPANPSPPEQSAALYHVGAVARLVGVSPAALRAWERRYGLPAPGRGRQGYRLYSEADVRALLWIKSQLDRGLTIGRAVALLAALRAAGEDPGLAAPGLTAVPLPPLALQWGLPELAGALFEAFQTLDEENVSGVLRRAAALHSMERVMLEVMRPALEAVGRAWAENGLPVAVEHFASQQVLRALSGVLASAAPPWRAGLILAGCAPAERHEIGLLMTVIRLRWRGWNVVYLGPDLSLERLRIVLAAHTPRLLMFSATLPGALSGLLDLPDLLRGLVPSPVILIGGQAAATVDGRAPAAHVLAPGQDPLPLVERLLEASPR